MNKNFQKIKIEEVLFFDAEIVRKNKQLTIDSREYELYQKKTRDRTTDEFLTDEELVLDYDKRAALKRTYNKVITIGVGFVKDDVVYIKDISGDEEKVIRDFVQIANQFKYCCSFNGIAFDLPMIVGNGMKYFNIAEELKDQFNPSGKKQWNLDYCIDLLEVFKGTHYYSNSLDEVCYHFNIPTPKDDISGSEVSEVFYKEGVERIRAYVKKDVLANINIFRRMQFKDIFTEFVDRSDTPIEKIPVLERIYLNKNISEADKEDILELLGKKRLTKKSKGIIKDILHKISVQSELFSKDKPEVVAEKLEVVEELIDNL